MGYDLGRAALACLSVLAVVFAASLFPAAGLGDYPGGIGAGGIGGPGGGPDGTTGGDGGPGDGAETTDPTPTDAPEGTTSDGTGTEDGSAGTTTGDGAETTTEDGSAGTTTDDANPENTDPERDDDAGVLGVILFLLLGGPVTVALLLTGGMATGLVVPRRTGPGGRLVLEVAGKQVNVGGFLQGLSQSTMGYVLSLSSTSGRLLDGLGSAANGLAGGLSSIGSGGAKTLAGVPLALGKGLGAAGRGLGGALVSVPSGFGTVFSGLGSFSLGWSGGSAPAADARSVDSAPTGETPVEDDEWHPPDSVEEAWERFAEEVRVYNAHARTPGEFARVAADRGLPPESVARLTQAFRDVRYGERSMPEERFERTREAFVQIYDHVTEDDDA